MFRFVAIALIASTLFAAVSPTSAQNNPSATEKGSVGIRTPKEPVRFSASAGNDILRHRSPSGTPCLTVSGFARPHVVNPNVYDHVITAKNSCPQRITMVVCYYKSQDCLPMEVPGGERKETILGSLPAARDFRFEFREKF